MTTNGKIYDSIVAGAGPGGLQGALHLARFNRKVLLIDRGGGRTRHAKHLANYLGHDHISGSELIKTGLSQVKNFGVKVVRARVDMLRKNKLFTLEAGGEHYRARFVIGATGARENLPRLKNLGRYFAESVFTCVTCDGYRTRGKKLTVLGNSAESVRLALGMKLMFTDDITLVLEGYEPTPEVAGLLAEETIPLTRGRATEIIGQEHLTGVRLEDSSEIDCEVIMLSLGATLNDSYLEELDLERNEADGKFTVNAHNESSLSGLYLTGSLCEGHAQAIIAAGQGAVAAIDINQRLLDL